MALPHIFKPILPPLLWNIGKNIKRRLVRSVDHYAYAPAGWHTALPEGHGNEAYWSAFIARERRMCESVIACVRANHAVLPPDDESVKYIAFGYVLALAARHRDALTILDYGGNLGEYSWIAKALVPGVAVEYHCKELPAIVAAGRSLSPAVIWHSDDRCLASSYDVVMFSGSLQYVPQWQDVLDRAANAAGTYLFLSDIPSVRDVPAYVMTQRSGGMTNLQYVLNRSDIVTAAERAGLRLLREWTMSAHPPVAGAPEQPMAVGWLFSRR